MYNKIRKFSPFRARNEFAVSSDTVVCILFSLDNFRFRGGISRGKGRRGVYSVAVLIRNGRDSEIRFRVFARDNGISARALFAVLSRGGFRLGYRKYGQENKSGVLFRDDIVPRRLRLCFVHITYL